MKIDNFFAELKRRNVYKVAVAYAIVTWLLIQIATQTFPFFEIPSWGVRLVVALLLIGFPIALILAWAYELTPEGIKRTEDVDPKKSIRRKTGRKITAGVVVIAMIALGLMIFRFVGKNTAREQLVTSIPLKSIAVLPFENLSANQENAFFADGVQNEILMDLAKVADLKVISRTSVMQYKNAATRNLREIAQQIGVAHVLEGSVQRAANRVRVTAQLIDARTDAHLWAEQYDRAIDDVFACANCSKIQSAALTTELLSHHDHQGHKDDFFNASDLSSPCPLTRSLPLSRPVGLPVYPKLLPLFVLCPSCEKISA